MKKIIALVLCVLSIASLTACSNNAVKLDDMNNAQISNPFVDCETLDEAAAISGFDMAAPDSIDGYERCDITAIASQMLQITYMNGDNSIVIRKAVGAEDISGDYTTYAQTNELAVNNVTVIIKGNDGTVNVATWINDAYSYAIDISGAGLSAESVNTLVQLIG